MGRGLVRRRDCGKVSNDERRSSRGLRPDAMPIASVHVVEFSLLANQSGRD